MFENARGAALVAATILTGLLAGLFYAYAMSVMPGLGDTDDRTFVEAMQSINDAILNGWLALVFGGAPLLIAVAGLLHLRPGGRPALPWIVAAFVLCLATVIITMAANVPLNDDLKDAGSPDRIGDLAAVRDHFEDRWVGWNIARTVTATGALGALAWSLVRSGRFRRSPEVGGAAA